MKCIKCGIELREDDMFCPNCGEQVKRVNTNNEVRTQNVYTYERNVSQQSHYNQQQGPTQQVSYNQQPRTNQGQYEQQPYQNQKSGNNTKIIVIAFVSIIIVLITIFIGCAVVFIKNNKSQISNDSAENSVSGSETSESEKSTSKKTSSTYKVNLGEFDVYIPDKLTYKTNVGNDSLSIGDTSSTWNANFCIVKASYQKLKQNKSYIVSYFNEYISSYNGTVSEPKVEVIDGVEYMLVEISVGGENILIAYTELNSNYVALFQIANEDNDFDKDMLKDLSPIAKNAEYIGEKSYLKSDENIKFTDIQQIFQKVNEVKE